MSESITAIDEQVLTPKQDWYVYLIENKLGQFYCGITTDPKRRIEQHSGQRAGGARALKGKGPLQFKWLYIMDNRADASRCEYWIKQRTKAQKQQLISHTVSPPFEGKNCINIHAYQLHGEGE